MDLFIFGFVVIAVLAIAFGCYVYLTNKIIKEQERELSELKRKLERRTRPAQEFKVGTPYSSYNLLDSNKIHFGGF